MFYNQKLERWVAMISLPPSPEGKRRRLRRTFHTKSEATLFVSGNPEELSRSSNEVTDMTIDELLTGWLVRPRECTSWR